MIRQPRQRHTGTTIAEHLRVRVTGQLLKPARRQHSQGTGRACMPQTARLPLQPVCGILAWLVLLLLFPLATQAQRDNRGVRLNAAARVALVIGNSQYAVGPLRNPGNDAEEMARALRQVDFAVTLLKDADQARMESAVNTFSQQLPQDSVGLFYFAGHGIQVAGENYLLPVGAAVAREPERCSALERRRRANTQQTAESMHLSDTSASYSE